MWGLGRRLLGGVRRRRTFVHAQSLSAVTMSFVFQVGGRVREKRGREGHTPNGIPREAPAFPAHATHSLQNENNLPDHLWPSRRDRAPRSFSTSILADPLLPPARGKIEGQAAQVFGVAVRCGKEIAFRFGITTAPLLQNRAFFFSFRVGIKQ